MFSFQRKPLFIGMSIGIALSLIVMPLMDDTCFLTNDSPNNEADRETLDDRTEAYDPVIRIRHRYHQRRLGNRPPMIRPRYYSTELGIREKIFVAVLTTPQTVDTLGKSLNLTLQKHVSKLTFFLKKSKSTDKQTQILPLSSSVVAFPEDSATSLLFLTLQYLITHFVEDYDFYFFTRDSTYVRGTKLYEFVRHISVTHDVYTGEKINQDSDYCSLSAGILISNSILQQISQEINWCISEMSSDNNDLDQNFGKCLLHLINLPCNNANMQKSFSSLSLPTNIKYDSTLQKLINEENFAHILTVYPVHQPQGHHWLHTIFSDLELQETHLKLRSTQEKLSTYSSKIPGSREVSFWPLGVYPSFKPDIPFDVIPWIFLNATHQFLHSEFSVTSELKGVDKMAVENIVQSCMQWLLDKDKSGFQLKNLVDIYQRLDPTRGMEYVLDVALTTKDTRETVIKRLEVVRPINKVELMPVPYVTEHTRVVLVLPVQVSESDLALEFLENYSKTCLEKQDNTILLLVLFYGPGDPGKGEPNDIFSKVKKLAVNLTTKFHATGAKIAWLSIRTTGKLPSEFAMLDLVVRKLSPDSLVLVCRLGMQLRSEFINRIRMNTVNKVQVFFPIPFVQYHPKVLNTQSIKTDPFEIKKDHGHYDYHNFEFMSFYVFDYVASRKAVIRELPVVRIDEDLKDERLYEAQKSVYSVFVQAKLVHVMRAVEPELRVRFRWQVCDSKADRETVQSCYLSQEKNLGSKAQLAKLVSQFEIPEEV